MKHIFRLINLFLVACSLSIMAQNVVNVKAKPLSNDNIEIKYDLNYVNSTEEIYLIEIYSSHNGFKFPLDKIKGDAGNTIKPGKEKKIIWDASQELSGFDGNISFKIKATLISAPWLVLSPKNNGALQKGKKNSIQWSGMSKGAETISIEIKNKATGEVISEHFSNTGNQKFELPKNLKTGYYELKVSNLAGSGTATSVVKIKNKLPLLVKLSPLAILGGAAAIYFAGGKSSTPSTTVENNNLPAPPPNP